MKKNHRQRKRWDSNPRTGFRPPIPVARGTLKPLEYFSIKERVGFEPTHRVNDLTVFKTIPFSQTWVSLRCYFPLKARRMSSIVRLKSA